MTCGSVCGSVAVCLRFCGPAQCSGVAAAPLYVVGGAPHRTPAPAGLSRTAPQAGSETRIGRICQCTAWS